MYKGVRVEEVTNTFPRTFQHVVPAALPASSTFTQTLDVSRDDLYAFTIVDTAGNGLDVSESSKFCLVRAILQLLRVVGVLDAYLSLSYL